MAASEKPHHDYHLVDPSPWPVIGAAALLALALGAIMAMHGQGYLLLAIGLAATLYMMAGWWRDVIAEAHAGHHSPVVQLHLRYGMILFILSEVMFFAAWFWAYFNASLFPADAVMETRTQLMGGVWPPKDIAVFDPWDIPFLNTLVLLASGTTVTWAHHALLQNDRQGLVQGLALTVALGLLFTALQAYEYAHAGFDFAGHVYGAVFFMATGFHGFHVIVGTLFLAVNLFRAIRGDFTPEHHFGFEAAAWYWHFVDVVWIFLFFWVYIWGGA